MSPKGYLSLQDVFNEIKDWIIIGVPFIVANQDIITFYVQKYLDINSNVIAFIICFLYFLYEKMSKGETITPKDVVNQISTELK